MNELFYIDAGHFSIPKNLACRQDEKIFGSLFCLTPPSDDDVKVEEPYIAEMLELEDAYTRQPIKHAPIIIRMEDFDFLIERSDREGFRFAIESACESRYSHDDQNDEKSECRFWSRLHISANLSGETIRRIWYLGSVRDEPLLLVLLCNGIVLKIDSEEITMNE